MKVSNINARADRTGKHNDRNFDLSRSGHIDAARSDQNVYWTYNGDNTMTFAQLELEFYKDHFKEHLDKQNAKYKKRAQYKRMRSMEDYRRSVQSRPEDKILQIGNMNDHASPEELWACALEYQKRFNERYGNSCKIIDMALHLDEATPHVHVRRVWIGHDDNGDECVGQGRAFEELGILPPDTLAPISRNNNAKITFTYDDQELFRQICREKGIEVEEPTGEKHERLSLLDFKRDALERDVSELTREKDQLQKDNDEIKDKAEKAETTIQDFCDIMEELLLNPYFNGRYDEEVRKLKQMELMERYNRLAILYYSEILPGLERIKERDIIKMGERVSESDRKYHRVRKFIQEQDLEEKYKDYIRTQRDKNNRNR